MLRRTPSLALRAGLIFISIYTVIFAAFLTVAFVSNSAEGDQNRDDGARVALHFASSELRWANGSFKLPELGQLHRFAAENPSLWILVRSETRTFSFGPAPEAAIRLLRDHGDLLGWGRLQVPDTAPELSVAAIGRYEIDGEAVVIAAGGVDPASLGRRDFRHPLGPEVLAGLMVIAGLGLLLMLVALPFFSRAIRPITAEAEALRPEAPEKRLDDTKAPRELLPLVQAFNATLDRLATELARRKRFITDVAHELRTPLAVVALRVEALEDEGGKADLRRGIERLTHLVTQMLDLERLSLSKQQHAPVDLVAAARDVLADLAPMAMKAGYDVSLDAPNGPVIVTGDKHAIARALTNLVGNSVAHAGGSGRIRVTVRDEGAIEVADDGPGLPPSLLPNLFEPFSRGGPNSEGCGLGLHLTREIMRAHGGDIEPVPSERGATFRLSFAGGRQDRY